MMSPLCTFSDNMNPAKWGQHIKQEYGELHPDYVQSLPSPLRRRKIDELLPISTQVLEIENSIDAVNSLLE